MKKTIFLLFSVFLASVAYIYRDFWWSESVELVSPLVGFQPKPENPKTFNQYSFENLRQRDFLGSEIKLEKVIKEEAAYTSWLFSFQSEGKKVTGMANLPVTRSPALRGEVWPVVVMLRGYADDEVYFTGLGTRKAAGVFAENGFITLAPDFLGFGDSDPASPDILEARFERPVTVLNLLASIKTLEQARQNSQGDLGGQTDPSIKLRVNPEKVVMWGHSNGGQIALSVLEISQRPIPTTLWAPMTRGFPESVLTYMGEMDNQGLKVKMAIDDFLKVYDPRKYSIDNYFVDIQAPIQLHQGTADLLVPVTWSDTFVSQMESLDKKIIYHKYRGNDHNLKQSWDLVVSRDLEFFRQNLK